MPYEIEHALSEFLWRFKKNLEKDELIALYFWVLNEKYVCDLENFETDNNSLSEKELDREFGRSLAYKVYEPNDSSLEHSSLEELKLFLSNFANEFDLSEIDECSSEQILEVIDVYCNSSNNSLLVF